MAEPFVGEIRMFPYDTVPKGWAQCNGQMLNIKQNVALYSLIGISFGGDGQNTFALPDLRGRVPLQPADTKTGVKSGEETHALAINEIPPHIHVVSATAASASTNVAAGGVCALTASNAYTVGNSNPVALRGDALSSNGSGVAHQNMQPYAVGNYCIALVGFYPTRP